jgi:hypothetical protein
MVIPPPMLPVPRGIADPYGIAVRRALKEYRRMSSLPRVTEKARELVAREFDARGPDVCVSEIVAHLERYDPELLDIAARWAADLGNPDKAMLGFGMFYRLLLAMSPGTATLSPLPRVSQETRALLVREIDEKGAGTFTLEAIAELEKSNPELLQTVHNFASRMENYLQAMQGFALLYRALATQSRTERARPH